MNHPFDLSHRLPIHLLYRDFIGSEIDSQAQHGYDGDERSSSDLHGANDRPRIVDVVDGDVCRLVRQEELIQDGEGCGRGFGGVEGED